MMTMTMEMAVATTATMAMAVEAILTAGAMTIRMKRVKRVEAIHPLCALRTMPTAATTMAG
jgi:hypothetical protein